MTAEAVVRRYQSTYGRYRAITATQALTAWGLANVDQAAAEQFVAAIVPIVSGAQQAVASNVDAYTTTLLRQAGIPAATLGVRLGDLRGVPADEVYLRPIITARKALADGKPWTEAMRIGRERLRSTVDIDVAMAQRAAMVAVAEQRSEITGYRRVLTGMSCAFCATASTQRYRRSELAPLHPGCDCSVAPLIGSSDPGHVINRDLLRRLKGAARKDTAYWESRHFAVDENGDLVFPDVAVHEHGELGPVLTKAGDNFDGPAVAA